MVVVANPDAQILKQASHPDVPALSELERYRAKRERFYLRLANRWPGTLLDAYDLLEVYPLPSDEIVAITEAAAAIARIYQRSATLLRTVSDDALLQMGLPRETLAHARIQTADMPDTVIGRLDLVKTTDGFKLLEFNADTPGLLIETFPINELACEESGLVNPNRFGEAALAAALTRAVKSGLAYVGKSMSERARIVFSSWATYPRDRDITQYLMSLLEFPDNLELQYLPLEALSTDGDGLFDSNGNQIDVLYRFYPTAFFRGRMFQDHHQGDALMHDGRVLFSLVQSHKLAIINPPAAFLLEGKAVQAVVWGLFQLEKYFNSEERYLIERYFLPTYLDPTYCDGPYVVKPIYGGEGDSIAIVDPSNGNVVRSNSSSYLEGPMVYQKYVELPRVELMTEDGPRVLQLLTSCFLVDGQPVGISLRAGEAFTDYSWWCVPVCVASS